MAATDDAWLDRTTIRGLADRYGEAGLDEALARPARYLEAPALEPRGGVRATVGDDPGDPAGTPRCTVTVGADPHFGGFRSRCTCRRTFDCVHARAVLVDLAVSPLLRDAVRSGDPERVQEAVGALGPLRARARTDAALDAALEEWLPASATGLAVPLRFSLTVHAHAYDALEEPGNPDASPALELKLRRDRERKVLEVREVLEMPLDPVDRQILALSLPARKKKRSFVLAGPVAPLALDVLRNRGGLSVDGSGAAVTFDPRPLDLAVELASRSVAEQGAEGRSEAASAVLFVARWRTPEGEAIAGGDQCVTFAGPSSWVWVPARAAFHPLGAGTDPEFALAAERRASVSVPPELAADAWRRLRTRWRGRRVQLPRPESVGLPSRDEPVFEARVDGTALALNVTLHVRYGDETHALHAGTWESAGHPTEESREPELERRACLRMTAAGLRETEEGWSANGEDAVRFWQEGAEALRDVRATPPIEVAIPSSLRNVRVRPSLRMKTRVAAMDGWLDTRIRFDAEGLEVTLAQLERALRERRRWVVLDDGSLVRIQEELGTLVSDARDVLGDDGAARLPPHQLARVERWLTASDETEVDASLEPWRERFRALTVESEPVLPEGLGTTLRPYQRHGLAWLQFLDALGAGGILADDMGLGKTVTALAQFLVRKQRDGRQTSLVVCPTSVASNWVHEARRFTPGLDVRLWYGADRHEASEDLDEADVIVTTYALLRRDVSLLQSRAFRYVVLDEAQNIKNADAATTNAARSLRAERRLCLTGTPVENRLLELWSLLDFCNPGLLGSARGFESRFERTVSMDPTGEAARWLRGIVRPFVLRRTKSQVLDDLPPREDVLVGCALGDEHRRLYDALAALLRKQIDARIQRDGLARSGLSILTALLRLRQMACDPRLVDPSADPGISAKRGVFLDLVRELVSEGRRALVFSQFVELLTLWRADLDAEGIAYEYLDGSTRDRDGAITRFTTGTAPLFLISLKAGGTGLNLTAADTVIHCDPWWNPAAEDQATDRAHRIGQTRAVTVHRLVARGTVEDRVVALQARKRTVADAIVTGDAGALRGLTERDVEALLAAVDESL